MGKITGYSRLSHHTISGTGSSGLTFSVPSSEDFTDGSWTNFDLALSEIGVNEQDKRVYIRIDDEIKEFQLSGSTFSGDTLAQVLSNGNTTGGNNIEVSSGDKILSTTDLLLEGGDSASFKVTDGLITNNISSTTASNQLYSADSLSSGYGFIRQSYNEILLFLDDTNTNPYIKIDFSTSEGTIILDSGGGGPIYIKDFGNDLIYESSRVTTSDGHKYNQDELTTTNATPTNSLYGINFGVTNSVVNITAYINGFGTTTSEAYSARLFGCFKNVSGVVTQVSTTDKVEKTDFSTATTDFAISGTDIKIQYTGEAAKTIRWVVRYDYQISY